MNFWALLTNKKLLLYLSLQRKSKKNEKKAHTFLNFGYNYSVGLNIFRFFGIIGVRIIL
jgi:hypothetical protein